MSFAAGILVSGLLRPELPALKAGFAALGALWLLALLLRLRVNAAAGCAMMLAAGALICEWRRPGPPPELDADPGETLLVAGCVAERVDSDGVQSRFVVELEPDVRMRVTLTARDGEVLPSLNYGQQVEIQARVRKPRNFQNPGAFDFVAYLHRSRIYWTATARGVNNLRVLPERCGSELRSAALAARAEITRRIAALYPNDDSVRRLLPALLTGDNSGLDRKWTDDYRRTGTYHALVVSGLHIAVLAGTALAVLRLLGLPLGLTLATAALLAWCYAAVVDWQPPVVRSAAGFTLFLLARWFHRSGSVLNLLAVTGILLLIADPLALFDPGFQLTFLSVGAIGGLAAPLIGRTVGPWSAGLAMLNETARDRKLEPRVTEWRIELRLLAETVALWTPVPQRFALAAITPCLRLLFWSMETAMVSACVQAALAAPLITYFHSFPVTGVLANITVVPALSMAVPVGLMAAATGWGVFALPAQWLLHFAQHTTAFWVSVEPGLRLPDPPRWLIAVLAAALAVTSISLFLGSRKLWTPAIACACCTLAVLLIWSHTPAGGELELTSIDVGQGDSHLLISPEGRTLLMDSGGYPVFDRRITARLDIGEDVVSPYLWRRRIRRLDAVAISHLHEDHAGGMARIIRNFRPTELWIGAVAEGRLWSSIQAACRESKTRVHLLKRGDSRSFGSAAIRVFAPSRDYVPAASPANNDSLVLMVEYGRNRFLLTGDAERAVESDLLARGLLPEVDVLKVSHHGSRTSTTAEFLDAVRPLFAVIPSGPDNLFGHPHPDVVKRLFAAGVRIDRTDTDGLVSYLSNGKRIRISRFSDAEANGSQPDIAASKW